MRDKKLEQILGKETEETKETKKWKLW